MVRIRTARREQPSRLLVTATFVVWIVLLTLVSRALSNRFLQPSQSSSGPETETAAGHSAVRTSGQAQAAGTGDSWHSGAASASSSQEEGVAGGKSGGGGGSDSGATQGVSGGAAETGATAQVSSTAASGAPAGDSKVIGKYVIEVDGKQIVKDLLDEPLPADCNAEPHADYDGPALTWGLTYKLASAAQCCQACKDMKRTAERRACQIWVFCPDPSGECWSPDIWNHTSGECWLKYQDGWDGSIDRSTTNLKVNSRGAYPAEYRQIHATAPAMVPWMAGLILRGESEARR